MAASYLWAWDSDATAWVKVKVDANGKIVISDIDPFTVQQTTPMNLRHVPHGYYAVGGTYLPLAVDVNGVLQTSGAGAVALADLTDVNLTGLANGDFIYYDSASGTWKRIAHKDATTGVHGVGAGTVGIQNADKTIVDADGDTKIQVEESADEDKIRMDVKGVEAFVLDDAGVLTLAKNSSTKAYSSIAQIIPTAAYTMVVLDYETHDNQNEFDTSQKTGTATATTASHLIDTTKNQFVAADVGRKVWNTTDNTYAVVTVYNSTSDLTIDTNIMANGETYRLYHSKFTCKVAGQYACIVNIGYASITDGSPYTPFIRKNGGRISRAWARPGSTGPVNVQNSDIIALAVNDVIDFQTYQGTAGNATTSEGIDSVYMALQRVG